MKARRTRYRYLCWIVPLAVHLVGSVLGPLPNLQIDTQAEIKRAAHWAGQVWATEVLQNNFDGWLKRMGLSQPWDKAAQPSRTALTRAEPFAACQHFFAGGHSPILPARPLHRPPCYEASAILHNGQTKTPVFVAQKLNRQSVADADEKRTNQFFADARLPRAERAELDDYKHSGYSRGHMAPAGDMQIRPPWHSRFHWPT